MRLKRKILLILIINAGFGLFGGEPLPVHAGPTPSFMGLDCQWGNVQAVSGDGQFIGGSCNGAATRWTVGGQGLAVTNPSTTHVGRGISEDGSVVVGQRHSDDRPFRWTSTTGVSYLNNLPGFLAVQTNRVSGDGTVVVGRGWSQSGTGPTRAWAWTTQGGMSLLGSLPGFAVGEHAFAASHNGGVITGDCGEGRPCKWVAGQQDPIIIGDLPGGSDLGGAVAVTGNGQVIVGWVGSASGTEAFVWRQQSGMVGLGDLPGGSFESQAWDVSENGMVVVGASLSAGGPAAFIWTEPMGMRDLRLFLETEFALNLSGWELRGAVGISNDGTVIVGNGYHYGAQKAWVAVIPEPGELSMLLLAAPFSARFPRSRSGLCPSRK